MPVHDTERTDVRIFEHILKLCYFKEEPMQNSTSTSN